MGFVSPATDYVEQRLSPASICTTNESRILETSSGFAVIEPVTRLVQGQVLLILSGGRTQFAKLKGRALITDDGEAIGGGGHRGSGSTGAGDVLHQQCAERGLLPSNLREERKTRRSGRVVFSEGPRHFPAKSPSQTVPVAGLYPLKIWL